VASSAGSGQRRRHVDHFGNLVTNLHAAMLNHRSSALVTLGGRKIAGLKGAYGDASPGDVVAIVGSDGYVEITVVNGNAARVLGLGVGEPVLVHDRI
jgi:S-adenosylmethionine hydrolase